MGYGESDFRIRRARSGFYCRDFWDDGDCLHLDQKVGPEESRDLHQGAGGRILARDEFVADSPLSGFRLVPPFGGR